MFLLSEKPTVLKNLKNRLEDQEQKEKDLEVNRMIEVWIHPIKLWINPSKSGSIQSKFGFIQSSDPGYLG